VESPAGPAQLLWITFVEIRFHWPRLLVVTLAAGLIGGLFFIPYGWLATWLFLHRQDFLYHLTWLASWPLMLPLYAGYGYCLLLAIQDFRPRAREVLRPFRSGALYVNVLAAEGLPALGGWALWMAGQAAATWILPAEFAGEHPTLDHIFRLAGSTAQSIIVLPFAFAGLDAVVRRCSFRAALARSLHFATTRTGLFAGFVVLSLIAMTAMQELGMSSRHARPDAGSDADVASWIVFLVQMCLVFFEFLLASVFYREFAWREREDSAAAMPDPAPASADPHA